MTDEDMTLRPDYWFDRCEAAEAKLAAVEALCDAEVNAQIVDTLLGIAVHHEGLIPARPVETSLIIGTIARLRREALRGSGRPASGATPAEACERCTHWMNLHDATGCTVVYNPEQPDVFCPCPAVPAERCWAQCDQECRDHCGGPVHVSAGDGAGAAQTTTHPFRPARKMIGRRMVDIDVCVESTQRTPGSSRQTCRLPADDPIHSGLDRPAEPGITDPDYWRLWAHPFQPDEFGRLCDAGSERKCDRRADHPIHQTTTPADHVGILDGEVEA